MEDIDLVSIIVPIYNSEKFLNKCIDSIINQTYSNIEIILVNDGSTDKSDSICQEYAKIDKRIKYFYQKNSGVSVARNNGIDHSKGKYIAFVDSDDWISKDMINEMYKKLKEEHVDVIRCKAVKFDNNNQQSCENIYDLKNKKMNHDEIIKKALPHFITDDELIGSYVWLLLINKEKIERFDKNLYFMEDTDFFIRILLKINSIYFFDKALYYYRYYEESVSKNKKNVIKNIYGILDSVNHIKNTLVNKNIDIDHILKRINNNMFNLFFTKLNLNVKDSFFQEVHDVRKIFNDKKVRDVVNNLDVSKLSKWKKVEYLLIKIKSYIALTIGIKMSRLKNK